MAKRIQEPSGDVPVFPSESPATDLDRWRQLKEILTAPTVDQGAARQVVAALGLHPGLVELFTAALADAAEIERDIAAAGDNAEERLQEVRRQLEYLRRARPTDLEQAEQFGRKISECERDEASLTNAVAVGHQARLELRSLNSLFPELLLGVAGPAGQVSVSYRRVHSWFVQNRLEEWDRDGWRKFGFVQERRPRQRLRSALPVRSPRGV